MFISRFASFRFRIDKVFSENSVKIFITYAMLINNTVKYLFVFTCVVEHAKLGSIQRFCIVVDFLLPRQNLQIFKTTENKSVRHLDIYSGFVGKGIAQYVYYSRVTHIWPK